jgi:hypothetical protein
MFFQANQELIINVVKWVFRLALMPVIVYVFRKAASEKKEI